ncbi:hypothetical protein GQ54DRAFT_320857 [Martensiomyces pterosporus]|nr:hypothetical protein GQ54DRAFT_320857 [Martensiomyces pterosporus]
MLVKISSVFALATAVAAHMTFIKPCARFTPYGNNCPAPPSPLDWDYDMTSPIGSEGSQVMPLCRYTQTYNTPTETWTPGTSVTINFYQQDVTGHYGGHCEFSISYDGGSTFVVLKQVLQYCFYNGPSTSDVPQVFSYNVDLPANLPGSNHAVFAWTWVNASGNREYYMNCADIAINGPAGSLTGKQMTIANYGAGYPTIPEFLGNYNTGLQYYTNATQVTVTGNGYGSGSGSTSSAPATTTSSKTSTTAAASTSTTSTQPVATTSSAASSTASSSSPQSTTSATSGSGSGPVAGGACSPDGTYQCADTTGKNANYFLCLYGQWVAQACSGGTACFQSGTSVSCSWPSS